MFKTEDLNNEKYISLETYRKNGQPVRVPVWFVTNNDLLYIVTRTKTGKIKRLKNNHSVKISPCTFNGKSTGEWISGIAEFATEEESKKAIELRKKKYGFMERIARFVSKSKGELIVFSIRLENNS